MHKVLVVGCGGSGAKTLAYMMDQLHADLAAYGIDKIPGCWQFLNVDTPLQEEQPGGLGSVTQQGGSYVACGVSAGSYQVVDDSLTNQLRSKDPAGLRRLATWMPRTPTDVPFPVTVGAGQCRGIGRLLILDRLAAVSKAVQAALAAMASPQAVAEAAHVASVVPGVGSVPDNAAPPMVLVISSMAGGSGASMTLDVCRLIAGVQTTPAIDPQLISVFLYTAEVFADVPQDKKEGMPGNTLAMLGEIIAAQSSNNGTAAQLDRDLYKLMGNSVQAPRAFKRVIPIGLKAGGTGAVFGDGTASGVFRGIGRGLARYIASPAFESYVQFDIANKVDIPNRGLVSWGVDPTETAWGSFGYASLSTGRDRYAEYAAQRLARRSVDHLLTGFRTNPADLSGDTQILDSLWQSRRAEELGQMQLPEMSGQSVLAGTGAVDQGAQNWLAYSSQATGLAAMQAHAQEIAQYVMAKAPKVEGLSVAEWAGSMSTWLLSVEADFVARLDDIAVGLARERAQELHSSILRQVRADVASLGIPYGVRVLTELRGEDGIIKRLAAGVGAVAAMRAPHPFGLSDVYLAPLRSQVKATLSAAGLSHHLEEMGTQLAGSILNWLYCTFAGYACRVLADMPGSALKPLEDRLNDRLEVLRKDSRFQEGVAGVADVATDLYSAWPRDPDPTMSLEQMVPARFATAHNEVVLMDVTSYPTAFEQHVVGSVPASQRGGFTQAYYEAVREIILGQWRVSGADREQDMIVVEDQWVPAGLPGSLTQMATPARYAVRLSRTDILGRARQFVGRAGEAFDTFVSQSLLDYLQDDAVGDFERDQRAQEILSGMKEAMAMARPLVEIDAQVYRHLHGSTPALGFTFSSIPFAHTAVADRLIDYASKENTFDGPAVAQAIEHSLSDDQVSRVDIFGSFPRTLPVAYSGLLGSVSEAWHRAEGSDGARAAFWQFRRARPLPGGLPVGDEDRLAMVRGWWLASLTGGIRRPDWTSARAADPIAVWDPEHTSFVSFPAPMLTSHAQMITPNSALAAVLESILLAYLDVDDNLTVFRPWQVLRHWSDPSTNEPEVRYGAKTPTQRVVAELLGSGSFGGLGTSPLLEGLSSPTERRERMLAFCDQVLADLDTRYLPGEGKRDEPGFFTNIADRDTVRSTPLSIDLAREMYDQLADIRAVVAQEPPAGAPSTPDQISGGMVY